MRPALVVALSVLVAASIGGEPPPASLIVWESVEHRIQARWPAVLSLDYDAADDFVVLTVHDDTDVGDAANHACATVKPVMHNAGSRALFAIYAESGDIIASWNRCELVPPGGP